MKDLPRYLDPILLLTYIVCLTFVVYAIYLYWTLPEDSGREVTRRVWLRRKIMGIVGLGGTIALALLFLFIVGVLILGVLTN